MNDLSRLFVPVTASPDDRGNYIEIAPTDILKPYIRCFWGSPLPKACCNAEGRNTEPFIVVPDTCVDVIFEYDYRYDKFSNVFCGINDAPFLNSGFKSYKSIFAVRFYFWAAHLFSDCSLTDTLNVFTDPQDYFNDMRIIFENIMLEKTTIQERIPLAEDFLINVLYKKRKINNNLMNAVHYILKSRGVVFISDLCSSVGISEGNLKEYLKKIQAYLPKKLQTLSGIKAYCGKC